MKRVPKRTQLRVVDGATGEELRALAETQNPAIGAIHGRNTVSSAERLRENFEKHTFLEFARSQLRAVDGATGEELGALAETLSTERATNVRAVAGTNSAHYEAHRLMYHAA